MCPRMKSLIVAGLMLLFTLAAATLIAGFARMGRDSAAERAFLRNRQTAVSDKLELIIPHHKMSTIVLRNNNE